MSVGHIWRRLSPWLVLAAILVILFGSAGKGAAWIVLLGTFFLQLCADWRSSAREFAIDDAIDMAEHFVGFVVCALGYLWLLQTGSPLAQ